MYMPSFKSMHGGMFGGDKNVNYCGKGTLGADRKAWAESLLILSQLSR